MDNMYSLWLCFWLAVSSLSLGVSSYEEIGGDVTEDITLNNTSGAYTVSKMLTIARNTTLTIDPGCRLLFQPGTGIVVMGSLVVLGTSDNRVAFEPEGGKVLDTGRSSVPADIRLRGETSPSEGRLEMYFNGHWTSVCTSSWDALKSALACHFLGYTTGAMHPVVIDDDDYWLDAENDWMMDFNCHGNESSFRECTFSEGLDYGSYIGNNECEGRSVVGLQCEGEGPRYGNSTWAGITWMNADSHEVLRDGIKTFRSMSRLYYVDVNGAGITHDLRRRPTLESYGVPPLLVSVKVEYSFGDGANFKDLPSETEIKDSTFSNNSGLGLSLSSAVTGRVIILTSEISYNDLGGLQINHTTNPSNMYAIYDGLCSLNATDNFTYPVYIRSEISNDCEMVFHATGSQRVLLRIYEDFGYLLEVRDGDTSTGPVIASTLSASTYAISSGSSLWVRAKSLGLLRNMLRLVVNIFEEKEKTIKGSTNHCRGSEDTISNTSRQNIDIDPVEMKYVHILLICACMCNAVLLSRADSCSGRCDSGFSNSYDCQCNTQCVNYGDCCSDYQLECLGSCSGRCDTNLDTSQDCQCNSVCERYGDCCSDYQTLCTGGAGPVPVTSADLTTLANTLWSVDGNRASSSQFTVNKQTKLSSSSNTVDRSSSKLLSYVDSALLKKDTYAKFISLLDNFIASTGNNEVFTSTHTKEKDAFISAIMKTSVMTETYNFLYSKGYVSSSQDFQYKMEEMWFKAYGRSSSSDSSGFEHVFVGELKSSSVTGFHNWIQLYHEEQSGDLNYYGYTKDASPDLLLLQFSWEGKLKKLSSIMFGSSPEFEMALFTTCFLTKPNSLCSFTLNGNTINIQTYDFDGANLIGSAYFSV